MAPRKVKTQGKKNNIKIKSKVNKQKAALKSTEKVKKREKPIENLKWLTKLPGNASFKKSMPEWLHKGPCEFELSGTNISESEEDPPQEAQKKYSNSDISEECNCDYSENTKNGILKQKTSSNSLVANYIKSGMNQVASFIVESAIRFGEQHGVVVPDKKNPNLYEFTPTDKRFGEKFRKIRFKIPGRSTHHEDAKKITRKSHKTKEGAESKEVPDWKAGSTSEASWRKSKSNSLENILPILEKLNEEEDVADRKNLKNLPCGSKDLLKENNRERTKDRFRDRQKRHKSTDSVTSKMSESVCSSEASKWKKFKRDSLELGRRRLREAACSRKQESASPTPT